MEPETMRSITAWLLLASVHQEPVPSQVTAAGPCAQVTRPGTTPRGTPSGESVGSNKEEPILLAAAIERANWRRVISILYYSSEYKSLCLPAQFPEEKKLVQSLEKQYSRGCRHHGPQSAATWTCAANCTSRDPVARGIISVVTRQSLHPRLNLP